MIEIIWGPSIVKHQLMKFVIAGQYKKWFFLNRYTKHEYHANYHLFGVWGWHVSVISDKSSVIVVKSNNEWVFYSCNRTQKKFAAHELWIFFVFKSNFFLISVQLNSIKVKLCLLTSAFQISSPPSNCPLSLENEIFNAQNTHFIFLSAVFATLCGWIRSQCTGIRIQKSSSSKSTQSPPSATTKLCRRISSDSCKWSGLYDHNGSRQGKKASWAEKRKNKEKVLRNIVRLFDWPWKPWVFFEWLNFNWFNPFVFPDSCAWLQGWRRLQIDRILSTPSPLVRRILCAQTSQNFGRCRHHSGRRCRHFKRNSHCHALSRFFDKDIFCLTYLFDIISTFSSNLESGNSLECSFWNAPFSCISSKKVKKIIFEFQRYLSEWFQNAVWLLRVEWICRRNSPQWKTKKICHYQRPLQPPACDCHFECWPPPNCGDSCFFFLSFCCERSSNLGLHLSSPLVNSSESNQVFLKSTHDPIDWSTLSLLTCSSPALTL